MQKSFQTLKFHIISEMARQSDAKSLCQLYGETQEMA